MASRCSSISETRLSAAHSSSPAVVARAIASLARHRGDLAGELADRGAELGGPAEGVAGPEGQPPGLAGGGGDQHPVVGDVLDPPAGGAEGEHVADAGLVDHLLVELADPADGLLADEEDAEQPAVGDGAAAGDGEALGAGSAGQLAGDAVPDEPRSQLGELVAGVAPGEQVERRVVRAAGEGGERRGSAYDVEELVGVPGVQRGGGDDLLGEYVERAGRHVQGLDAAGAHPLDGDRRGDQVAAVLGEQHAARDLADLVTGATDPLQGAGHRRRRLDLDDQVDRAHVDAELEAAGRDHAGEPAALEVVLDDRPLLLGDRAVVGAGDERSGALGLAGLGHHRRPGVRGRRAVARARTAHAPARSAASSLSRAVSRSASRRELANTMVERVLLDQVEHALLDVRPERPGARTVVALLAELGHVLDRDDDLEVPLLLRRAARRPRPVRRRRGSGRPRRSGAPSRRARCAAPACRAARRDARGRGRGGRRAWCRRRRGPRR